MRLATLVSVSIVNILIRHDECSLFVPVVSGKSSLSLFNLNRLDYEQAKATSCFAQTCPIVVMPSRPRRMGNMKTFSSHC